MTYQQVLDLIQAEIIANGNNEITANVLRPILEEMLLQPNDLIGDLSNLQTTDTSNLVNAINEVLNSTGSGITIFTGEPNPNTTSPAGATFVDFYIQTSASIPIKLFQLTPVQWVEIKEVTAGSLLSTQIGNTAILGVDGGIFVSAGSNNTPIQNVYPDINTVPTGLLDNQPNQTIGFIQKVLDASDDPNVTIIAGESTVRYYEYLGGGNALLTDYQLLTNSEGAVLDSQGINQFTINSIITGTLIAPDPNEVNLIYENVGDKVLEIGFPPNFSTFLLNMETYKNAGDFKIGISIYNKTNGKFSGEIDIDFQQIITALNLSYRVVLAEGMIDRNDFLVGEELEFYFSIYTDNGGGGGSNNVTEISANYVILLTDETVNDIVGNITYTLPLISATPLYKKFTTKNSSIIKSTLLPSGADVIDTQPEITVYPFDSITVQNTGTTWIII